MFAAKGNKSMTCNAMYPMYIKSSFTFISEKLLLARTSFATVFEFRCFVVRCSSRFSIFRHVNRERVSFFFAPLDRNIHQGNALLCVLFKCTRQASHSSDAQLDCLKKCRFLAAASKLQRLIMCNWMEVAEWVAQFFAPLLRKCHQRSLSFYLLQRNNDGERKVKELLLHFVFCCELERESQSSFFFSPVWREYISTQLPSPRFYSNVGPHSTRRGGVGGTFPPLCFPLPTAKPSKAFYAVNKSTWQKKA